MPVHKVVHSRLRVPVRKPARAGIAHHMHMCYNVCAYLDVPVHICAYLVHVYVHLVCSI